MLKSHPPTLKLRRDKMKTQKINQIKPSHLRYGIDDLRAGGTGHGSGQARRVPYERGWRWRTCRVGDRRSGRSGRIYPTGSDWIRVFNFFQTQSKPAYHLGKMGGQWEARMRTRRILQKGHPPTLKLRRDKMKTQKLNQIKLLTLTICE